MSVAGDPTQAGAGRGAGDRPARGREPGRPAPRAEALPAGALRAGALRAGALRAGAAAAGRPGPDRRIGIRELRQHASVYVDLAEKGYTVDITNRGRLVARLVPANEPGSPMERLIAAGIIEPADESGGAADLEPYPWREEGR